MLEFLIKLLIPGYYEYQDELEREIKELERECVKNER